METKLLPTDWVYENIFHLSEDQYDEYRDLIVEDQKRAFRNTQISGEGNDPKMTGKSYGTPHDLANLYSTKRDKAIKDVPDGYDENEPGRPKTKLSDFGTDKSNFSRDPLGKSGMTADDSPDRTNNVSALALEENSRILKKLSLGRLKGKQLLSEEGKSSMLDEKNIIEE